MTQLRIDDTAYPFHPDADLFPLMEGEDYAALVADIKANGLEEPIKLYQGQILDGRNRYRACRDAKREPRFEQVRDGVDTIVYVVSLNEKRRHLNDAQRAAIGADVRERIERRRGPKPKTVEPIGDLFSLLGGELEQPVPQPPRGKAAKEAADMVGSSRSSVERATAIKKAAPEVHEAMKAGTVTIPQAQILAKAPEPERLAALAVKNEEARSNRIKDIGRSQQPPAPKKPERTLALLWCDVQVGLSQLELASPDALIAQWDEKDKQQALGVLRKDIAYLGELERRLRGAKWEVVK